MHNILELGKPFNTSVKVSVTTDLSAMRSHLHRETDEGQFMYCTRFRHSSVICSPMSSNNSHVTLPNVVLNFQLPVEADYQVACDESLGCSFKLANYCDCGTTTY